jgi:hypothetical protein
VQCIDRLNRSSRTGFAPNDSNAARFLGRRETGKRLAKIVAKGAARCAVTWLRLTAEAELNRISDTGNLARRTRRS